MGTFQVQQNGEVVFAGTIQDIGFHFDVNNLTDPAFRKKYEVEKPTDRKWYLDDSRTGITEYVQVIYCIKRS